MPQQVLEILANAGLAPARLQIEITESVLLDDSDTAKAALATLRNAGVRVALDDFGTGYSSISYLRRYAVDKLKIDRSFVSQLGAGDDTHAIVEAMVRLARALEMQVTAEGVETAEQRDIWRWAATSCRVCCSPRPCPKPNARRWRPAGSRRGSQLRCERCSAGGGGLSDEPRTRLASRRSG